MENNITGLTEDEVIKNRQKYGYNIITNTKKESFLRQFIITLGDPIIRILLIALAIKIVFLIRDFDWYETVGIVIAIFLASFISTISEYGSEKAFEKLQEEASKIKCRVKRNDQIFEINAEEVVYGDIVVLEAGDKIPADGYICFGKIYVDESSINGESKEILKVMAEKEIRDKNKVYMGTVVCSDYALMRVNAVGDNTLYGKIAIELQDNQPISPLKKRLTDLAKIISRIGYIGAGLVAISYLFSKIVISNDFKLYLIKDTINNFPLMMGYVLHALTLCVTVIVVAVPEGLPMMITLVLSSNMKRMLKNNVLVRKLVGIETAGNINLLFTDKTGTLTKGKPEVVAIQTGDMNCYYSMIDLKKKNYLYDIINKSLYYNNASKFDNYNKIVGGNITDKTLLKFIIEKPSEVEIIKKVPFSSDSKFSLTTVKENNKIINYIKGAPEIILTNCDSYLDQYGNKKILKDKEKINQVVNKMANNGIRVIALCMNDRVINERSLKNSVFIGLVFIKDEIRKEASEAVGLIKAANIDVIMITGDNLNTAKSIAKEVGILTKDSDLIICSDELKRMTDLQIKENLKNIKVIARALPSDKSRLVKISQELDLVVGMTGDGVNDAAALKKADVGFSMGSGTEVAKEASDIIILDDNILSIAKAILFGRTIFKSIRKFIIFQLTVNFCAISLSIIGPFIGVNTPVTVIQMLWINMVMDTFAGLAFSFEPPLKEFMMEKPKKKDEGIINGYMFGQILFTGLYSSILCILFLKLPFLKNLFRASDDNKYLMTAFFGLFIFMSIFNSFNARTQRLNLFAHLCKNKIFIGIIAFIVFVQITLIYFGGNLFRTAGLTLFEFQIMLLISSTVIPIDWIRKLYLR
ncbi:MAG TPA: calcium-translocating P-type ATPase, PMCA-type, partial [Tenericutes bacterium]|nr:calcium-translocating P-type ATPase, PMCA-type [Mycoplasmatota bacterium]